MIWAIYTVYFWILLPFAVAIDLIIVTIMYPFISQKTFVHYFERIAGSIMYWGMFKTGIWSLKIINKDNHLNIKASQQDKIQQDEIQQGQQEQEIQQEQEEEIQQGQEEEIQEARIIIANHLSFIDSMILSYLPGDKKYMLAKKYADIPLFCWLCKAAGLIPVNRLNKVQLSKCVDKSVATIADGCSFVIYPEGKRNNKMLPLLEFKTGAFRIAQQSQLKILPVALIGTNKALSIGGICNRAEIKIILAKPFTVEPNWQGIIDAKSKAKKILEGLIEKELDN